MKKIFFAFLFVGITCYGQTNDFQLHENQNRTEVKFNAFAIALGALDLEFERTLSQRSAIGLGFFTNFRTADDYKGFNNQNSVTAYYRYYLGKRHAQGAFVEAFGMYNSSDLFQLTIVSSSMVQYENRQTIQDFGVGLSVGYKWVSKKGLILQSHFGLGRNLFQPHIGEQVIGRVGISIGYSF
jgi:hypothetical protein